MKTCRRHNVYFNKIWIGITLVFMMPIFLGCAGYYGRLQKDDEVTRMFRSNSVPENYRYYFDGRSGLPYAIIGIDPDFQLVSHFWEPLEPNSKEFASKVNSLWEPEDWTRYPSDQGAFILDSRGKRIGIWYSRYSDTTIAVHEDNRIEVYSPSFGDSGTALTNLR